MGLVRRHTGDPADLLRHPGRVTNLAHAVVCRRNDRARVGDGHSGMCEALGVGPKEQPDQLARCPDRCSPEIQRLLLLSMEEVAIYDHQRLSFVCILLQIDRFSRAPTRTLCDRHARGLHLDHDAPGCVRRLQQRHRDRAFRCR
jgi:hypothetical protein